MDSLTPETRRLLAAKEARRQRLVRASFPEKIAALIRLQTMAAPIQRSRGRVVSPWRMEGSAKPLILKDAPPRTASESP